MHAEVIAQNPRTAIISVKQPMANDKTSVKLVINMATADSDNVLIIRAFRVA